MKKLQTIVRRHKLDFVVAMLLFLAALALYIHTLVPAVLDGDQGHFQYIPAVLGIPYPPGFPLYVLIGFFWSHLPIGTLAFRMNLLSAVLGGLTIGLFYLTLRLQRLDRVACVCGTITLALMPPLWKYSTWASEHALNNLLTVLFVASLIEWLKTRAAGWLLLLALTFGFGITNHPSFVLFAPATLVLIALDARVLLQQKRAVLSAAALVVMPCLLYLLFPIRGAALTPSPLLLPDWSVNVARGLVSVFFEPTPDGWLHYFTASRFTGTMVNSWNWMDALRDWGSAVFSTLGFTLIALAIVGSIQMFRTQSRLGLWFSLSLGTIALVAPQFIYGAVGQATEFSAYLERYFQPVFILLVIFVAWGLDAILVVARTVRFPQALPLPGVILVFALAVLLLLAWKGLWSKHSDVPIARSIELQSKWNTIQRYPPEPDAILVGHWGDLTPFWYMQTAAAWRSDLLGYYPPQDPAIDYLVTAAKPVYFVGDPLGWAPETTNDRVLTPWGPLVRISETAVLPPSPLPERQITFEGERPAIKLLGYDLTRNAADPEILEIAAYWETLAEFPLDTYLLYVALSSPSILPEMDTKSVGESLVVSWLSGRTLPAGRRALGIYQYHVPPNLPAGEYEVELFLFSTDSGQDQRIAETGETRVRIGTVSLAKGEVIAALQK